MLALVLEFESHRGEILFVFSVGPTAESDIDCVVKAPFSLYFVLLICRCAQGHGDGLISFHVKES